MSGERGWGLGARLGALGAAVAAANAASYGLRFSSELQVVAWLSNGLLTAFLLHEPRARWPWAMALVLAVDWGWDLLMGGMNAPPPWPVGFATINTLEAVAVAVVLRLSVRGRRPKGWLVAPRRLAALVTAAALVPLGSCLAAGALIVSRMPDRSFWAEAQKWFLGDAVGNLLSLPLAVAWAYTPRPDSRRLRHPWELLLLLVGLSMASQVLLLFTPLEVRSLAQGTLAFWPLLVWGAARLDDRGITLVLLLTSAGISLQARLGEALFSASQVRSTAAVISTQTFLFSAVMTGLLLWSAWEYERRAAARLLEQARASAALAERQRSIEWHLAASERGRAAAELVAGVAHDLRNALGLVGLQGSLLRSRDADAARISHDITSAVDHAVGVLSSFVAMHRREPKAASLFELRRALDQVVTLVGPALPHTVALDAQLGPEPGPMQMGHATEIQQMVVNLLLNARDALEGRGRIELSLTEEGEQAVIRVRDDGRGIPEPIQAQLFEPFFTTKRPGSGTGLGLYVVRTFAERHGGTVEVESRPGKGSTFTIRLPRVSPYGEAPPSSRSPPSSQAPLSSPLSIMSTLQADELLPQVHRFERVDSSGWGLNMLTVKLPEGGLLIYSPTWLGDGTFEAIERLGPPRVLVAPNHYHYLSLQRFRDRYPDALAVASDGARPRLASKNQRDLRSLDEAAPLLPDGGRFLSPEGLKSGEVWLSLPGPAGPAWLVCDALFNVTRPVTGVAGFFLRRLHTCPGLSLGDTFRWLALKDARRYGGWVRKQLSDAPPARLVFSHGEPFAQAPADALDALLRRRLGV